MKSIVDYINENNSVKGIDRATIEEKCPTFFSIISQFCRDKNSEDLEFLIDAWTMAPEDFNKTYKDEFPFSNEDIEEFEEKYLTPEAIEEVEKLAKK